MIGNVDDWGLQVHCVHLPDLEVSAEKKLGMVLVQPYFELVADSTTPFRISAQHRKQQIALIEKAFQIRQLEIQERGVPIPFILFPELAIPVCDPDGLNTLQEMISQAQGDLVFIGGLEGVGQDEARHLVDRFGIGGDPAQPVFGAGAFVNLCVIAVKHSSGRVNWYFQAKLRPSQWEQPRNMAQGKRVLYFVGNDIAFLCLICFDHIASQGQEPLNAALCQGLIKSMQPNVATLDFLFVPQFNAKPDGKSQLENTRHLLNYQTRTFKNDMTSVVIVNRAAPIQESSEFGRSGFYCKARRWQIPEKDSGPKGYVLKDVDGVTSAVFRKRTQAIHVAALVPPSHNVNNPGNPRQPLDNPRSYVIGESCDSAACSCLPGTTNAAGCYVECSCLPCSFRDALPSSFATKDEKNRWQGSDLGQSEQLQRRYGEIRQSLLTMQSDRAHDLMSILLLVHDPKGGKCDNPDLWSKEEVEAVIELTSALSVLAEIESIHITTEKHWTALLGAALAVAAIDGEDRKHSWMQIALDYHRRFDGEYLSLDARRRLLLIVALRSSGLIREIVEPMQFDITKPTRSDAMGDKDLITKPTAQRFFVCQDSLFAGARQAPNIAAYLKREMSQILG